MSYPVSSLRIRLKCAAQINLGSKKKISRGNFPRLIFFVPCVPVPGIPSASHSQWEKTAVKKTAAKPAAKSAKAAAAKKTAAKKTAKKEEN